jgi:TonB family protein
VIRLQGLALASPELPRRGWREASWQTIASALLHTAFITTLVLLAGHAKRPAAEPDAVRPPLTDQTTHLVFIARPAENAGGGGGGGGNRQPGPIRRAEGIGRDRMTVPIVKAPAPVIVDSARVVTLDTPPPAGVILDAKPLASGTRELMGLLEGGVSGGTSLGPGSGGGVGDGVGTGIGSGEGPGVGPGFGGGIGGGPYRPGGAVISPRVLVQVQPKYTNDALLRKIQGTVELELIVTRNGMPANIRIRRSLDPGGLDDRAVAAVSDWRFEPGKLSGKPVDVLVTVFLDFRIQ